jgi:hypothetical protein
VVFSKTIRNFIFYFLIILACLAGRPVHSLAGDQSSAPLKAECIQSKNDKEYDTYSLKERECNKKNTQNIGFDINKVRPKPPRKQSSEPALSVEEKQKLTDK